MNVLISSAGRRVALVRAFIESLERLREEGSVIAIDISSTSPALYAAHRGYIVPRVNDSGFAAALFRIIESEQIGLIVPTIDPELPVYAKLRMEIELSLGARVAISPPEAVNTCIDKYRFYQSLSSKKIPTPRTVLGRDAEREELAFPVFVKPRYGFASVNTFTIEDREELRFITQKYPDLIVQEHLGGREFTIDVLSDFKGRVVSIVPRERLEVRAGEVTRSRTEKSPVIIEEAMRLAAHLGTTGPATMQCLMHEGVPWFFEVNPRVGGGLPASIAAGADTPGMLIRMARGEEVVAEIGNFTPDHYMLRYDDALFMTSLLEGGIESWRKK
ncbi:MAG: ATP-grasp domain-containing protein [Candidatus Eremiobacteraeota bacterium]|nr:ATP-grasp domain-containing protein [Candidatus Eremiobacteraeota bacterium]